MGYSNLENIYDKYCPMLYGIALEICISEKKAERLLTNTFKKIHEKDVKKNNGQHFIRGKYPAYCITLMQLIIKTAKELYPTKFKPEFRLKQFENIPLINQIICDQISLEEHCKNQLLTRQEGLQMIREEFGKIRNAEKENNFTPHLQPPHKLNLLKKKQLN